jgi:hypothetical protein
MIVCTKDWSKLYLTYMTYPFEEIRQEAIDEAVRRGIIDGKLQGSDNDRRTTETVCDRKAPA